MKNTDIAILTEKNRKEIIDEYNKNVQMEKDGITDRNKYNDTYLTRKYNHIDVFGETFDFLESVIKEYREIQKENKDKIWFKFTDNTRCNDEDYDDDYRIWYEYFTVKSVNDFEQIIETKTKQDIKDIMYNEVKKELWKKDDEWFYKSDIDCKLLWLFKEGTIDWEALKKLVYSDCEL